MTKTKKIIASITGIALMASTAACAPNNAPPKPTDANCKDWEWDSEEGVYVCDDSSSGHYRHYYYGNTYYGTKSSLQNSSSYKSYKSSSSFKGGFGKSSSAVGG